MTTDRTATHTVKGYYYQFDKTIIEILNLQNDNDSILVEGIEDIDVSTLVSTTAIQCKYYAAQKYSHSVIRDAIIAMLADFIERKQKRKTLIKYHLYIYCQNSVTLPDKFTCPELQEVLRWKTRNPKATRDYQKENSITDVALYQFAECLSLRAGSSFEQQQLEVLQAIQDQYKCDRLQAELYFYNNALAKVISLASENAAIKRTISKQEFLSDTNQSEILFNAWYIQFKGKTEYAKLLKHRLKNLNSLLLVKSKGIFWDVQQVPFEMPQLNFVAFVVNLNAKYFSAGKKHHRNPPWTIFVKASQSVLKDIKTNLLKKEIWFNDGMESLYFSANLFNEKPVVEITRNEKLNRASFLLKLVSADTLKTNRQSIKSPDVLFYVSRDDPSIYFDLAGINEFHDLKYCDSIEDLNILLT